MHHGAQPLEGHDQVHGGAKHHRLNLTKTEFALLKQLVKRPRVVYTRDQLLDVCYAHDEDAVDRNIDSHIKRLRKKFRDARPDIDFNRITTHYGSGYAWSPQSA